MNEPNQIFQAGASDQGAFVIVKDSSAPYARLADRATGELMHPLGDPQEEVDALYVKQIGLLDIIANSSDSLVIWDVGLGMATNAMAVVKAVEKTDILSSISLISFDLSLEPLGLALAEYMSFPHLTCTAGLIHRAPLALHAKGEWRNHRLVWNFVRGDFTKSFGVAPKPNVIIFDPFSVVTNPAMWSFELLAGVSRLIEEEAAIFVTYSASTALRAALLACGWWVAKGAGFGRKGETTLAITTEGRKRWPRLRKIDLLSQAWLQKWERSSRPWPQDILASRQSREGEGGHPAGTQGPAGTTDKTGAGEQRLSDQEAESEAHKLTKKLKSHPQFASPI